jgi:hypothetical protein
MAAGIIRLACHATEFKAQKRFPVELVWVCIVSLLAILGGVFTLRGRN